MRTLESRTAETPSQCLWTVRGSALAIAAHESVVVTGGADGFVCAYNADGALVARRSAHEGAVVALGFARDPANGAPLVVSVGSDRRAVISDLSFERQRTVELPSNPRFLATNATNATNATPSRVAVVLADGRVLSWVIDEAPSTWAKLTDQPVTGLVAIDRGERFVLSTIGALWVTDAHGALVRTIDGHGFVSEELHSVSVLPHPDGHRVIVDASGEAMRLYTTRDVWVLDVDTDVRSALGDNASHTTPWVALDGKWVDFVSRPSASPTAHHCVLAPGAAVVACVAIDHDSVFTIQQDRSLKRFSLRPVESGAPSAGAFVRGFDRVPGELCTWDRDTRSVHRFSARDGSWIATARTKHLANEQLALFEDGSLFATSAPEHSLVGATLERWNTDGTVRFSADGDYELPRAAAVTNGATYAAAVAQFYGLQLFSPTESALFARDTPHRTWGGAVCVRDDRVVSYGRDGLVVGWSPSATSPIFEVQIEKAPCAMIACRDRTSVALLIEHDSRELELVWLDADTGAVLKRSARAHASIALSLVEREDHSVVSAGVPPVVFDRRTGEAHVATKSSDAYCALVDKSGRFAILQGHDRHYSALDIDRNTVRPLADCKGSTTYAVTNFALRGGVRFVVTGLGNEVFVIDAIEGRVIERRALHDERVLALASSRDGSRVLSAGADGVVRVYHSESLTVASEHPGPRKHVFFAEFDDSDQPAHKAFVWGNDDREGGGLWEYDLAQTGSHARRALVRRGDISDSREPPSRGRWGLASSTRVVRFDLREGRIDAEVPVKYRHAQRSTLSDSGRWLVLLDATEVGLVDLERRAERSLGKAWTHRSCGAFAERASVPSLVIASDATLRAIALEDGSDRFHVSIADAPTKAEKLAIALDSLAICALVEEPRADRRVEARSLTDGSLVWRRPLGAHAVSALAVDHGRVVVGDKDGRVRVFNAQDGEPIAEWGTPDAINDIGILDAATFAVIDGAGKLHLLTVPEE